VTDKKRRPTRRRLQSELDDLRERAGADGDDLTVTINHVDVPRADDTDDADDGADAMALYSRWSTDDDVEAVDVDPEDVRAAVDGDDDAQARLDAAGYGTPTTVGGGADE